MGGRLRSVVTVLRDSWRDRHAISEGLAQMKARYDAEARAARAAGLNCERTPDRPRGKPF